MAIIKWVNKDYSNENPDFQNCVDLKMMRYICDESKTYGIAANIGSRNVLLADPKTMADQFITLRNLFHKNNGRLLIHIIVSFQEYEVDFEEARSVAYNCASYFYGYQVVFAIHTSTRCTHIHFLVNTVSFLDGHKYSCGYSELINFINYASKMNPGFNFNG